MSVRINPPPLEIPPALLQDKAMRAFFDALLRTIYQMWTELFSLRFKEKVLTTDATTTPAQRVLVSSGKTVYIEARVVGRRTGGSAGADGDSAFYVLQGAFKNIGGTVSLVASTILNGGEDQAGWDCGFAISGSEVVLVVIGAANNNITWQTTIQFFEVGV